MYLTLNSDIMVQHYLHNIFLFDNASVSQFSGNHINTAVNYIKQMAEYWQDSCFPSDFVWFGFCFIWW